MTFLFGCITYKTKPKYSDFSMSRPYSRHSQLTRSKAKKSFAAAFWLMHCAGSSMQRRAFIAGLGRGSDS
jgi:hypothetical protein